LTSHPVTQGQESCLNPDKIIHGNLKRLTLRVGESLVIYLSFRQPSEKFFSQYLIFDHPKAFEI